MLLTKKNSFSNNRRHDTTCLRTCFMWNIGYCAIWHANANDATTSGTASEPPKKKAKTRQKAIVSPICAEEFDTQIMCKDGTREKLWLDDVVVSIDVALASPNANSPQDNHPKIQDIQQMCYSIALQFCFEASVLVTVFVGGQVQSQTARQPHKQTARQPDRTYRYEDRHIHIHEHM